MQPLHLHIKDFMLYGESSIDFTKLSPATAIIGMENSNTKNSIAVGKTTIFHAINYAIYNAKPSTNINKIIRDGAKKAEIIFDFSMSDGNIYRIERTRTKSTQNLYLKVKVNNEWKDLTDRTNSLTEQKIADIIKINQETFESSSYFKQNDQTNLASVTPSKRKEIIRDLLHLEEWAVYEKKAKSIRDDYSNKLSIVKKTIDNLGEPQIDCNNLQLELSNIESVLQVKNSSIEETSKILDSKKLELEDLKRNMDLEYPQLLKKLKNEQSYLTELNSNLIKLSSNKDNHSSNLSSLTKKSAILKKEIEQKENDLTDLNKEFSLLEEPSNDLYQNICNDLIKVSALIKQNELLYKAASKPLPSDDFCPTCNTLLNEEHRTNLLQLKQIKLTEIKSETLKYVDEQNKLDHQKKDFENKLRNYKSIKDKVSSLSFDIKSKNNTLNSDLETINQKEKLISSLESEIITKSNAVDETKKSTELLSDLIKAAESKSKDNLVSNLNIEIKDITSKLAKQREENNSLMYKSGKVKSSLETRKNDLEKLEKATEEKKDLEYKFNVYKAASVVFGANGIPALIIHSILDSLQNETNKVLDVLKPGIQVKFFVEKEKADGSQDETLGMGFFSNGKECDFIDLSGGQRESVAISLKFALCTINKNRCNADVKFVLLDEIDQGLDESTINSFFNVLKNLSKNISVFLITHNLQLKEKFDSFILVNKVNGVSSAEVVN